MPVIQNVSLQGSAKTFWFPLNWCQLKSIPFHGLLTDSNQIIGGIKEKLIFLQIQHIVHFELVMSVDYKWSQKPQ